MNVLITGANGFIGKALTKLLLSRGDTVYAIVTSKEDMLDISSPNLKVFELYFDDYNKIARFVKDNIDVLYHFAWHGLCGEQASNVTIQLTNIIAIETLINEGIKLKLKKFVFASTMNTLEVRSFLSKPSIHQPRGVYIHVASKMNASIVARVLCNRNSIEYNEGLIAMVYGENNKSKMIPNVFIYSLLNNITPKMVAGEGMYDIVYIDDVIKGFCAIGTNGINGKTYYIGHSDNATFKEIFSRIRDVIKPGARIDFGAYSGDNFIDFSLIDRTLLEKDTGWKPEADFEDSIKKTANWILESEIKFL